MDLSEIKLDELDIDDLKRIGSAPAPIKFAIIIILCIGLAIAGYFLDTTKQAKAANLEAYKQQLDEMRTSFGTLLRQLPNETEIETLLTDISQTGISAGLDIDYFKPEGLRAKEFYSEYPIKLKVTGHYHEFAEFISGVAALPRIVTLQDIEVKPSDPKGGIKLTMELTAITYQYLDEAEDTTTEETVQ